MESVIHSCWIWLPQSHTTERTHLSFYPFYDSQQLDISNTDVQDI